MELVVGRREAYTGASAVSESAKEDDLSESAGKEVWKSTRATQVLADRISMNGKGASKSIAMLR